MGTGLSLLMSGSTAILAGSTDQPMDGSTGPSSGLLPQTSCLGTGCYVFFSVSGSEVWGGSAGPFAGSTGPCSGPLPKFVFLVLDLSMF